MASEEQINNQGRLNDLREEELAYLRESEEFLGQTISKSAQLADAIKSQVNSIRDKVTLDQKLLQFSKQNVDVLTKLKVDYSDVAKIDKDRKSVLDQIQKNNNLIAAQGSDLTQEVKDQARAYVDQEKSLQDQQKALADKISKQEQLEALIKAQEAAGLKVDIADKALLKNAQESARLQRMKVVGLQAELAETSKLVDPQAVSLALLQDQNTQLEEAIGYLDEEEAAVVNMEKAQGLFNTTLGAAGSILKKVGLESSALYLGLEEGRQAAENTAFELTKGGEKASTFGDRIKVLGAGIAGTFRGMANEIKAIGIGAILFKGIQGAFNMLGGKVVTGFIKDLTGQFSKGISFLKDQFFSLQSYIDDAKAGEAFFRQITKATADLATNLGLGTSEARELVDQAREVSREVGMMPEELAAVTGELQQAFGTTQKFSTDTVKTMGELTNLFGLTNQEASEFVKLGKLSGQEAGEVVVETRAQIQALKERNNMAISEKAVMQEIAKSSALQRLNAEKFAGGIANAAFSAKKLGMEMSAVQGVADSLLSIEDSIAKEMEAELLIGKDLQLDKARQLALQGDLAGVAEEISGQIGSAADFQKMNVMQQEALAAAVGMTKEQLAETLETQELLAGSGFDDMSKAQEEFRKLLKETGSEEEAIAAMRERGANDQLVNQFREISLAEKREQQERDLVEQQLKMAQATNKLFDAFNNIQRVLLKIRGVIVTAMKPFFDSFGKTVGEGGKAFETMVLPYAKKLGEFMNDVGLRLVDIVKNNGPQIKAIFSGVLELFGSIYNVVGGVIKQLLGIKESGASSKGFFESIKDTISVMIEKLQNVDITALTEKVKGFIDGVKNIFKFIFDKVGAIGDFLGKNKGITKMAGLGAFAFTVAPGAVKDIAGSVGSAITKKAAGGLKTLGSNLGNKLTEKLGLGKLFGGGGKKPTGGSSDPLFVQNVGEGAGGGLMDMVGKMGGRKAGIGGGFKKGFKGLMDYAKMAMKGGRAGQVGRARLLRAGKGLLTGQGASFVGGTGGKGAAQAAGKLAGSAGKIAGAAGKLGKVAGSLGKIAAGGGIGAVVGLAAEASLGFFQKKAEAAAGALDEQIAITDDAGKAAELEQERQKKLRAAQNLEIAGTTAKYAGLGATIGSVIPGVGTAVGAAVGAVAGFTVGMVNAEKTRKREASAAGKFAREQRRAAIKQAKALQDIELRSAALQAQAAKEGFAKEQAVRLQFAEQLGATGATAADKLAQLQNLDIDNTSEAFKSFAQDALDAGNITKEEFAAALEGTISPLDLMEKAAKTSGANLKKLYNSAIETAGALSGQLKKSILEQAGVNEDVLNSQTNAIEAFTKNSKALGTQLFTEFEDALDDAYDSEAIDTLRGEDSDSKAFQEALLKKFEAQGATAEQVAMAMQLYANDLEAAGEDFDLDNAANVSKLIEGIGENLVSVIQSPALQAAADAAAAEASALKQIDESGILKNLGNLTKEQVGGDEELAKILESVGLNIGEIAKDGIDSTELQSIRESLTEAVTAGLMGVDGSNSDLLNQLQGALQVDDFIIRPGEAPIKFNEDDLLIGGTNLDNALGTESNISPTTEAPASFMDTLYRAMDPAPTQEIDPDNNFVQTNEELKAEVKELKEIMGGFVQQMAQIVNRPVVVELDGNKVGESIGRNSFLVQ